jgi:hypothetical protein
MRNLRKAVKRWGVTDVNSYVDRLRKKHLIPSVGKTYFAVQCS